MPMPNSSFYPFLGIGVYIVAKLQKKYGTFTMCDEILFAAKG